MITLEQVQAAYPDCYGDELDEAYWGGAPNDYFPLLKLIGELLLVVRYGDYQGDTLALYRIGEGYGVLSFGWGSCSGCDALAACDSYDDIVALGNKMESQMSQFPTKEALLNWIANRDWRGCYFDLTLAQNLACGCV